VKKEVNTVLQLPDVYTNNIKFVHKEKGQEWLDHLPKLINYCEKRWNMKVQDEPFELSFNFVCAAIFADGGEVVLKLSVPSQDFLNELEALKLFNTHKQKMVQLLDYDEEKGIILLERLKPGQMLSTIDDDKVATRIAASVLKELWIPIGEDCSLPTTKNREDSLIALRKEHPNGLGPISAQLLEEAEYFFKQMNETSTQSYLLHGDLHHYNILSKNNFWMVIDPQGLIGEREYDLIQYLLNKLPEKECKEIIQKRIDIFAEELGLNKERILMWGIAHSILSTAWSVEDNENYSTSFFQGIQAIRDIYHDFKTQK
jgi:streptomycin 6-kinase